MQRLHEYDFMIKSKRKKSYEACKSEFVSRRFTFFSSCFCCPCRSCVRAASPILESCSISTRIVLASESLNFVATIKHTMYEMRLSGMLGSKQSILYR